MTVVIRYAAPAGIITHNPPPEGAYLEFYDPDGNAGRGESRWTRDVARAMTFPDHMAAREFWAQTSTVRPRRPDGKPNKPLTAYTIVTEDQKATEDGGESFWTWIEEGLYPGAGKSVPRS